jgi:AcrR family transcriptional regulator
MARQDISEERRAQIMEAALEVFARQGFHQARMDDIAQASGLSKGALYLYYKSKDAIIGALMRSVFSVFLRGVRSIETADGSARERILTLSNRFADEMERLTPALGVLLEFYSVAARDRTVRSYIGEMYTDFESLLARVIEQGMEGGEFRQGNANDMAMSLIAIWEGITIIWVMANDHIQVRAQSRITITTFLDGMRSIDH